MRIVGARRSGGGARASSSAHFRQRRLPPAPSCLAAAGKASSFQNQSSKIFCSVDIDPKGCICTQRSSSVFELCLSYSRFLISETRNRILESQLTPSLSVPLAVSSVTLLRMPALPPCLAAAVSDPRFNGVVLSFCCSHTGTVTRGRAPSPSDRTHLIFPSVIHLEDLRHQVRV